MTMIKSRAAAILAAVQAFHHATPDAAVVPADAEARARVTRDEIAALFARELYARC
jgi:hypothetical protein